MTSSKNSLTVDLPSDTEIEITRHFDFPRALVFKAFTTPEMIARWWGPREYTTTVDKMDVRPGGQWRFYHGDGGPENSFHGEYLEIVPPERLVYTFEWEGMPGHSLTEHVTLEEIDGRTKVIDVAVFSNREDRDGMLQSGMESGARESYERLEELLQTQ